MAQKPTQKLLPFDEPPADPQPTSPAARHEPSDEALAAFEAMEDYLRDGRGRPVNALAEEALRFLARALLDAPPKRGYIRASEERMEALKACPEIVAVKPQDEAEFQRIVDDVLDCLCEQSMGRSR